MNGPVTKGAQAGEAEGPRSQRVVEMIAYQSCGNVGSAYWTKEGFGGRWTYSRISFWTFAATSLETCSCREGQNLGH